MSEGPTSPTPPQMSLWEDSPVSRFPMRESSAVRTTPAISGRRCLGLSGNAGPLGLLEKMLLGSSNWAWTKYSLTWRARATPRGRLIFQLARLAPRTSASDYGLLHTPTAKANQMAPSMATRDSGSWGLAGAMWPTPNAREKGGGEYQDPEKIRARMDKGHQTNLGDAVKLWPTAMTGGEGVAPSHLDGGHGWNTVNAAAPNTTGKLNPMWVAWLMGYPTGYLNSVRWETPSSRKSRKK